MIRRAGTARRAESRRLGGRQGDRVHGGAELRRLAIASALLGGALALLAHSLADEAIVRILNNAIASVRAGELRHETDGDAG